MLGRVTKYRVNNDAPSEVFEASSDQERKVSPSAGERLLTASTSVLTATLTFTHSQVTGRARIVCVQQLVKAAL